MKRLEQRHRGFIIGYLYALQQNGLMPTDVYFDDLSEGYRIELGKTADKLTKGMILSQSKELMAVNWHKRVLGVDKSALQSE